MSRIVIDTETTGLDPEKDELLQVSIIDDEGNDLFNSLFRPERTHTWDAAQAVNGITPEMVMNAPKIADKKEEISRIVEQAEAVIGYNTMFDITFLTNNDIRLPVDQSFDVVDVMLDFAPIYGEWSEEKRDYKWQKLTKAAEYYGYDWESRPEGAHNSLGDCFATLHVYKSIKKEKQATQKKEHETELPSKRRYSKAKKGR